MIRFTFLIGGTAGSPEPSLRFTISGSRGHAGTRARGRTHENAHAPTTLFCILGRRICAVIVFTRPNYFQIISRIEMN